MEKHCRGTDWTHPRLGGGMLGMTEEVAGPGAVAAVGNWDQVSVRQAAAEDLIGTGAAVVVGNSGQVSVRQAAADIVVMGTAVVDIDTRNWVRVREGSAEMAKVASCESPHEG